MTKSRAPRIFRSYSESQKKRIVDLFKEGNNAKQVADKLNIPYSSTSSIIRKHLANEQIQVKTSQEEVEKNANPYVDLQPYWHDREIEESTASAICRPRMPLLTQAEKDPVLEDVLAQLNVIKAEVDSIRKIQKQFNDVCIEQFQEVNNAFLKQFENINYVIRNNIVEFNERVIKQVKYSSDKVAKEVKGVNEKVEKLGSFDIKVMRQFNVFEEKIKSIMNSRTVVTAKEHEQKRSLFESIFPPRP